MRGRSRTAAIVALERKLGHELRRILELRLLLLTIIVVAVVVGRVLLLPGQFHCVVKVDGMDQLARNGVPKHLLVFGNVAPIPILAGKLDGIPGSIAVQLGTGRPHLLSDVGGILGPFGNRFDLDVVVDADPSA